MSTHAVSLHPPRRVLACPKVIPQRVVLAASVRVTRGLQMRKSVVAGPAHTAGAVLRLGVTSLRRDQIELLLRLIQAEADALLVE